MPRVLDVFVVGTSQSLYSLAPPSMVEVVFAVRYTCRILSLPSSVSHSRPILVKRALGGGSSIFPKQP